MNIQFSLNIAGTPTDATSVVFRDPSNAFGVRRTDTLATVVAAGTALTHTGVGEYQYTFVDPEEGIHYNYWIEWVYLGNTYRYEQTISAASETPVYLNVPAALPRSCISLARYAALTGYSECALMGVNNPDEITGECENPIWTQYQRDTLLYYLGEAQDLIEAETHYPLCPTYFTDEFHTLRERNAFPVHAKWTKVIAAGIRAASDILASATIDYSVEPALIGPLATSVTDVSEIHVFYPGSDREIEPSQITLSGGNVSIWIPRCRLVSPDAFPTPTEGLDYSDLDHFLEVADVRRIYTDESVNAQLVYAHRPTSGTCSNCGCASCGEATADACVYVLNPETGALDVLRGSYGDGVWTAGFRDCYCARPSGVRVNYLAGLAQITAVLESAVIRLAHALMPTQICGCDVFKSIWERDTNVPDFISTERELNPWGVREGSWWAWKIVHKVDVRRMSVI